MKFLKIYVIILGICISCDSDDRVDNPFLPNLNVNFTANLNLPQFDKLEFPGETVIVASESIGIKGLILHNVNGELFTAFELSDPNHTPNACSSQTVEGTIATCNCEEGNQYYVNTGLPLTEDLEYGLKPYKITKQGNNLIISN